MVSRMHSRKADLSAKPGNATYSTWVVCTKCMVFQSPITYIKYAIVLDGSDQQGNDVLLSKNALKQAALHCMYIN